jgi:hypothetical protein
MLRVLGEIADQCASLQTPISVYDATGIVLPTEQVSHVVADSHTHRADQVRNFYSVLAAVARNVRIRDSV